MSFSQTLGRLFRNGLSTFAPERFSPWRGHAWAKVTAAHPIAPSRIPFQPYHASLRRPSLSSEVAASPLLGAPWTARWRWLAWLTARHVCPREYVRSLRAQIHPPE